MVSGLLGTAVLVFTGGAAPVLLFLSLWILLLLKLFLLFAMVYLARDGLGKSGFAG